MTRFGYYAPFWIGVAIGIGVLMADGYENVPAPRGLFIAGEGLLSGLAFQLVMLGLQGTFAQVLPVPIGRSIRGRGAVITGGLLILSVLAGVAARLVAVDEVTFATIVIGIASGICFLCAIGVYIWCLPAAVRDFERA